MTFFTKEEFRRITIVLFLPSARKGPGNNLKKRGSKRIIRGQTSLQGTKLRDALNRDGMGGGGDETERIFNREDQKR